MTILTLAYPFAPAGEDAVGGAEQVVAQLDRAIVQDRHASLVLAAAGSRLRGTVLTHATPSRIDGDVRSATHAHYTRKASQLVTSFHIDAVHAHGVDFAEYLPPPGPPLVVTLHLPPAFYARSALELARPRTTFVCVSETQRAALPHVRADVRVIPNGVRLDAFTPSPEPIAQRPYALVLGRVCPEKGIDLAISAARAADVDLVIAGKVFGYEDHERYFEARVLPKLDARRRFVGPVGLADKRQLLAGARCLLVPSLAEETSCLSAMEALASGTPVVALRSGALPEVVEHGKTGFLVSDVESMARAIERVRELSSAACRRAAEDRFDVRVTCAKYLALYAEVARSGTSARIGEACA